MLDSIKNLLDSLLSGVPNIIVAILLLVLTFVVAKIVKDIIIKLANKFKLSEQLLKIHAVKDQATGFEIVKTVASLGYFVVFVLMIPGVLDRLGMNSVSAPLVNMVKNIFDYIPTIIGAGIIIFVGLFIAKLVCNILESVLKTVGFDKLAEIEVIKSLFKNVKPSMVVAVAVKVFIIAIFVIEVINSLQLTVLTNISESILLYLPNVIGAVVVIVLAYIAIILADKFLSESNCLLKVVKSVVSVIAGFMVLNQLGIAPAIVEIAFIALVATISLSCILAFGLGGKDFAKEILEKHGKK